MNKFIAKETIAALVVSTLAPLTALAAPVLPSFNAANFAPGAVINNPYLPLTNTSVFHYQGVAHGTPEKFDFDAITGGPTILGVATTARRDRVFQDNRIHEDTLDYLAQDTAGNVWYFGEDVVNYQYDAAGNLVSTNTSSSWRSGVNSGLPGFFMPASLTPGFHYYQEFAPFDGANDEGQTLAADRTLSIGIGDFTDVLAVLETSGSGARGIKYYARGLGLIAEDTDVSLDFKSTTGRIELVGTSAVPLPATLPLLGAAFGFIAARRRKSTATG